MSNKYWIGGTHAVYAAINNNKRKVHQIISTKDLKFDEKINFKLTTNKEINRKFFKFPNFNHQNIAAEVSELPTLNLLDEIQNLTKVIILDGIKDIGNIGAIVRTALAFEYDSIIVNKKDLDLKNPGIYKTSSGAIEKVKIFRVPNLSNALEILKKNNFWSYTADLNAEKDLYNLTKISKKNILIFGSEDKGVSMNILKKSDFKFKIGMSKNIESLNVSNVASISLAYFFKNNHL